MFDHCMHATLASTQVTLTTYIQQTKVTECVRTYVEVCQCVCEVSVSTCMCFIITHAFLCYFTHDAAKGTDTCSACPTADGEDSQEGNSNWERE